MMRCRLVPMRARKTDIARLPSISIAFWGDEAVDSDRLERR